MNDFIEKIKEVLEVEEKEIKMSDFFREYEEWNSLAYLSLVALFDEEYDIQIEESDFQKFKTVEDLYNATKKNKKCLS